jgi:hypothetical protein
MTMIPRSLFATLSVLSLVGMSLACTMRQTSGSRASGQSKLMDDTFAGQNACNPDDHTKPFVVEWDATDMSSFESIAANDIVFVQYEGCTLKVLDECKNDSIRGEMGAYKPPDWTTGQLETVDIANTGELAAKLPLGQATLGARVSGGEKFHMEYYVAGTRYASRDAVFVSDLKEGDGYRYGCEETTHFVYGFNLGAFALGSANELNIEGGASAYGFGVEGKRNKHHNVDKKGGDLASCKSDSATEIAGCKAPIRLNLRKIRKGESPEAEAMAQPDTPESLTAAAMVNQKIELSADAQGHVDAANQKLAAGDGKGCLKELAAHDKLNAKHKSTNPSSPFAMTRAMCVMRSGKCDAGKVQLRKALEKIGTFAQSGPEQIDSTVDVWAAMHCQGKMNATDTLRKALMEMTAAAYTTKKDVKYCDSRYATIKKLIPKAKPRNDDDSQIINAKASLLGMVPACYQRAGDCKKSFAAYKELTKKNYEKVAPDQLESIQRSGFESLVSKCKGK